MGDGRSDDGPIDSGNDVAQNGGAEQVVGARTIIAKPVELEKPRAPNAFTGMQPQAHILHAGLQAQFPILLPLHQRTPLPRPTDGSNDTATAILDGETRAGFLR